MKGNTFKRKDYLKVDYGKCKAPRDAQNTLTREAIKDEHDYSQKQLTFASAFDKWFK